MSTPVNLRRLSLMVMPSPLYECVSDLWVIPTLLLRLWLAIEEIIHHHDVMRPIIIRPRSSIAARDPHSGDARVAIDDPKKERLPSPGEAGTKLLKSSPPSVPKHSISCWLDGCRFCCPVRFHPASLRPRRPRRTRGSSPVWYLRPDQARRTSSQ